MAPYMSKHVALVLAMAAAIVAAQQQLQPSEAATTPAQAVASDADVLLRFPGRPGTRPRSPIFPGFPGARPSPPAFGFPGTRPSPAPTPGVPSTPVSQPPCPKAPLAPLPGFPGLPGSVGSTPSSPTDCVTPLAGLMTCGTFLTGSESETPTPQSECCSGLAGFLNSSSSAGNGDDRTLRCLCPVILGDVNKMLPKPVDPVRMMYLPIACGVVLPPQVLFICFTGQPTPPVVSRIPEIWEKPSSALSP
ncbi:leucine-rich repeat extensin-like protein 5 isoform X2 [Phragmites australis]|uniref:leucine-rich repeat extensin-like protein 5 isoform X2 n=1 Tax=Phragmites australis TaxID=29695 RepID=UPI002D78CFBA|nr:leucine-rich repeat extensin-like protein 5 isoform X2 [Phragmites australis]